jgi:hypothetical protein
MERAKNITMPDEEQPGGLKRIALRFEAELWRRLDDKRHYERTSFQALGEMFFESWLEDEIIIIKRDPGGSQDIPPKYRELVREFLAMLEDPEDAPVTKMILGHLQRRAAERITDKPPDPK